VAFYLLDMAMKKNCRFGSSRLRFARSDP